MIVKTSPTFTVDIYIAGNMQDIERTCAEFCQTGLCVFIKAGKYVYTGGREDGAEVRLINYPRFPAEPEQIREKARALADALISACCQWSAALVDHEQTEWRTNRPDKQDEPVKEIYPEVNGVRTRSEYQG